MEERVNIDLRKALTHIEDAIIATERDGDQEDIEYFKDKAKEAFDGVPRTIPYVEDCLEAIDDEEFVEALKELENLAAYIEQYGEDEYTFVYNTRVLEQIQDQYKLYT